MRRFEIGFNPCHKVILECTLDNLVKDIRGNHLVNICTGEFPSKGLMGPGARRPRNKVNVGVRVRAGQMQFRLTRTCTMITKKTYLHVTHDAILIPEHIQVGSV